MKRIHSLLVVAAGLLLVGLVGFVVWSRGGVDWRALASGAAGAAGAAGGTVDAQGAHGARRAAGAAGAPLGVWGDECAQKPAADGPAA